ncbi:MAG: hypothetical protein Q8904_09935 [Bacteroidota bacterium]|nr:hypothetical protein [Bacteroidota bacterium]
MRIITLKGDSDKGKTTTLNIVYNTLLNNGGKSTNKQKLGGDPNDFFDLVIYNNQKIYFFTMGDYSGYLIDSIRDCNSKGYDLLICACNSRFVRPFQEMNNYLHNIIDKTVVNSSSLELAANNADATTIINLI